MRVVPLALIAPFLALIGTVAVARPPAGIAAPAACTGIAIVSITQLQDIGVSSTLPLSGRYCLAHDLDAGATSAWNSHRGFLPIAGNDYLRFDRGFSGVLDGQAHTISNLTIANTNSYGTGLIAVLQGTVRNLRLANAHISGQYDVGGIAGDAIGGTIVASSVTGTVSSTKANGDSVGGVAGYATNATVENSFSSARVTVPSNTWAGGIAGYNIGGHISNSYSTGLITGVAGSLLGGFLGKEDGPVTNSFWDVTTSALTRGAGSLLCQCSSPRGLTDSMMKQKSSFIDAGWNFATIWTIANGTGYPELDAPTAPPASAVIPIAVQLSSTVARGAIDTISVRTAPSARILLQVTYPGSGGFKKRGHADASGSWQHSWTVHAQSAGVAVAHLTVSTSIAVRHFSKQFQVT